MDMFLLLLYHCLGHSAISVYSDICVTWILEQLLRQTNKKLKCLAGKYAEMIPTYLCFVKNFFLLLQVGLITSYVLWAASRTFGVFLLSRIVGGISKGNVSLSTAIIADLHSPKARSKGMVSYTCRVCVWFAG